jgi:hypothetical protein
VLSSLAVFYIPIFLRVMLTTLLGSIGFGLVWGWLLGMLDRTPLRAVTSAWASAATLLLGAVVYFFARSPGTIFFLGVAILTLLLHLGWRRHLSRRFSPLNETYLVKENIHDR